MIGWIKLHRSLIEWEWYDDKNALILLIHLLVTVNYEDKKWKGILIKSGSRVTSWETLKNEITCMSIQQIRTAMDKLEVSGEITRSSTNKYQVVSLVKWDKLQHLEMLDNNQNNTPITIKQQSNNNQITTTKEVYNIKEVKEDLKKIVFNFRKALVEYGFNENLVIDWLKVRKNKKASDTETALNSFIKEIEKRNCDINQILEFIVTKSWSGFKWSWYDSEIEKEKNVPLKKEKQNAGEIIKNRLGL